VVGITIHHQEDVIPLCRYHWSLSTQIKTPGTPGFGIIHHETIEDQISADDQAIYHAGVGTLLYLIKHLQPDIANTV
jgi:hypothetical protein